MINGLSLSQTIIPFVPTDDPQLSRLVYEMILAHFLRHDHDASLAPFFSSDDHSLTTHSSSGPSTYDQGLASRYLRRCSRDPRYPGPDRAQTRLEPPHAERRRTARHIASLAISRCTSLSSCSPASFSTANRAKPSPISSSSVDQASSPSFATTTSSQTFKIKPSY
jgi:hypothetical protein